VESFAKRPPQFGFAIEYTDSVASLRYYQPDFAVVLLDGTRHLVETKGREDPDVPYKDGPAQVWCENATALTDAEWHYAKVPQLGFESRQPEAFADLAVFALKR
jgi:type III restriction enzyme